MNLLLTAALLLGLMAGVSAVGGTSSAASALLPASWVQENNGAAPGRSAQAPGRVRQQDAGQSSAPSTATEEQPSSPDTSATPPADASPSSSQLPVDDASTDSAVRGPVDFPADSGVVDVTAAPYGARGDGVTDDTAALRRALLDNDYRDGESGPTLNTFAARTVYLPAGTYLITDSLIVTGSSLRIVGAGEGRTTIKLADRAAGFGSASSPKYVLQTGTKMNTGQANSGFANYIEDLTLDVGAGNPGAVGVRYAVANSGAMQHVTIRSSDPAGIGYRGLTFETTPGPGIVRDVTIEGFDTGVYLDRQMPNNLVLTGLHLQGQRQAGLVNDAKNVVLEGLVTSDVPVAVVASLAEATTILIDSELVGRGSGPAIKAAAGGFVYVRDVSASGFSNVVTVGDSAHLAGAASVPEWSTHGYQRGATSQSWNPSGGYVGLHLPIQQTPDVPASDPSTWASVGAFGGSPGSSDVGPALQRAIDSGAEVIYFPYGHYTLSSPVQIRGNVQRIDFLFSELVRAGGGKISTANPTGTTVWLENVATSVPMEHNAAGDLVIRDVGPVSGSGSTSVTTGPSATGDLFLENWGPHAQATITRPIHVWARQINREARNWSISGGATVWLAGDNVETAPGLFPEFRITGSTFELIGGAWDNLGDSTSFPRSGAAVYQATDSQISILMPGLMRGGGVVGHWISERRGGAAVGDVYDSDLVAAVTRNADRRVRTPLYISPTG